MRPCASMELTWAQWPCTHVTVASALLLSATCVSASHKVSGVSLPSALVILWALRDGWAGPTAWCLSQFYSPAPHPAQHVARHGALERRGLQQGKEILRSTASKSHDGSMWQLSVETEIETQHKRILVYCTHFILHCIW